MKATYDPKPIPIRIFDWTATEDDYEPGAPQGMGATRAAAVQDLEDQIAERGANALSRRDGQ